MSGPTEWVVDLGHSRLKWAQACNGNLIEQSIGHCAANQPQAFLDALVQQRGTVRLSAQSHPDHGHALSNACQQRDCSVEVIRLGQPALPIEPAYSTLGCDRWLALQWPASRHGGAFAVIDCGTAITVDLVDAQHQHRGGWILAGLRTSQEGLQQRAPGLPLVDLSETDLATLGHPALNTPAAVGQGALMLALGGIERCLAAGREAMPDLAAIWLTGGDAPLLLSALGQQPAAWHWRHDPLLVLRGLAMITAR